MPQQREHVLGDGAAVRVVGADGVELLPAPAGTEPEQEPPAGELLQRRGLLRQHERVAQRRHQHRGAEPEPLGDRREVADRHQRLEHATELRPVRPGRQHVVGEPRRREPEVLGLAGQVAQRPDRHGRRLVREHHVEIHGWPNPAAAVSTPGAHRVSGRATAAPASAAPASLTR